MSSAKDKENDDAAAKLPKLDQPDNEEAGGGGENKAARRGRSRSRSRSR